MTSDNQIQQEDSAQSDFKPIKKGITQVSEEKFMGEIFQRNLEENTDLDDLKSELKDQGLEIEEFPALCLMEGLEKIEEGETL